MLNKLLGLAVIAVSFVSTAHAADLSAATHHHYLLGHWSCIGHVDTPDGDRFNTVGSWKIKRAFHGHVYDHFENYTGNGFVYKAKGVTSYDKLAGVLNRHVISSMGSWTRYVSSGWKGDTLTWEGESHRFGHPTTGIEQVITKKDDNSFELNLRVHDHGHHADKDGKGDSGWQSMYTGTCTRDGGHDDGHKDDGPKDDGVDDHGKTQQGDDIEDEELDEAL